MWCSQNHAPTTVVDRSEWQTRRMTLDSATPLAAAGPLAGGICVLGLAAVAGWAWGGGTLWYARRRGRWPSALSARLFTRLLGDRSPLTRLAIPAVVILPRRHH